MKINKAIFGVDESYFLEFWPIQAKICKELLEIEPVLFLICDEDSDFYDDGHGLVKKIKKVKNNQNGNVVHSGLLACIVRMYGTKYFPNEVCITCDLDMLMINREYFINQIKNYDDNSLVIYSSDAYDLNRPEAVELFNNEPFPFIQEMYNYPYNAAKGKTFNQILDTDCTFEEFVNRHANYKHGYNFMWMIDEFYFADCVNNKNHGVEVHKLKRGYTSPWIADRRIDRGNFPVQLEWEGEIEFQKKYGIYDEQKLRDGYYIDVNCCRPYSKYKNEIDKIVNIILDNDIIEVVEIHETTELCEIMERHGSDKSCKPTWVDYEGHNYTKFYYKLFNNIKDKNINFFELGLGTNNVDIPCNMGKLGTPGASLRGWKEYFPNANIYGADIDKNILFNEDRVKTFYCDQTNSTEIQELWEVINKNFDIIIDDGLHEFNANLNFLRNSLSKLNYGGYYIIEDVVNGELNLWKEEIKKLRKEFTTFDFKIVKLKWTHDDNNLIVIKNNKVNYSLNDTKNQLSMYELGIKHNTDKVLYHRYDRIYDKFLNSFKKEKVKLFEIGCGSEYASFKMWKEYFPDGMIYSMDIDEELETDRGVVYKGDQTNIEDLKRMVKNIGECDIIIDDGSHIPQHQITTFEYLFENMLKNGGVYIIEDIECTYWNPKKSLYGYEIGDENIISYFESLPHKINSEFSNNKNDKLISSITFYKNCIILTKMTLEEIEEDKREYRFKEML